MAELKYFSPLLKWLTAVADEPTDPDSDPQIKGIYGGCTITVSIAGTDPRAVRVESLSPSPALISLAPIEARLDDGVLKLNASTPIRLVANCPVLDLPEDIDLWYTFKFHHVTYNGAAQELPSITITAPLVAEDHDDDVDGEVVKDLASSEWINQNLVAGREIFVRNVPDDVSLVDDALVFTNQNVPVGTPVDISSLVFNGDMDDITDAEEVGKAVVRAASAAAARDTIEAADAISAKQGAAWWNTVMAAPAEMPTITMATTSQISGGTTLSPTADYDYDPFFRYDGCVSVQTSSGGVTTVNGSPEFVMPEIVTDAQNIEFLFRASRTGTQVAGVRAVINGKLHSLAMQRFDTTSGTDYYFKLSFAAGKVRHIKFEHDGLSIFKGVVVSATTVAQRPKGPHQMRHTAIGDSLTIGGPNMHIGAEVSGDVFYLSRECHAYYQSVLMGCDSFINLGDGGTGWGDNDLVDGPFSGRIDKALASHPHVLGFYGSRNDAGFESQVLTRVMEAMARVEEVPIVLVSGPQQTLSTTTINDLVRQGVVAAGRTFLDVQGAAASPASNPTGHPTIAEQQNIAKVAHSQLDMTKTLAKVEAANASRQPVSVVLSTSPTTPVNVSTSVTLTATLAGNASALLGKVQFYDGAAALGSPVTVASGSAAYVTSALTAATHALTAKFLPADPSSVKSSTSNTVTFVVSANLGMIDTFTRADGAIGVSENGKTWDNTTSTGFDIVSGTAGNTGSASTKSTYCPTDAILGTYRWKMAGTYATQAAMLMFCKNAATGGVDGSNHVFISCGGGTNNWRIWTRIANTSTAIATGTTNQSWTAGDDITCEVTAGTSSTKFNFVVKKNGTTVITVTDFDLTSTLATKSGIGYSITSSSNLSRFDEIEMTAA